MLTKERQTLPIVLAYWLMRSVNVSQDTLVVAGVRDLRTPLAIYADDVC